MVNVIQPGYVSTEMTEKIRTDPKLKEIYAGRILLGRFAEPEEMWLFSSFWRRKTQAT